jgi:endonuclease/exonuclease/phosphatase family metal-dependent hydrolase
VGTSLKFVVIVLALLAIAGVRAAGREMTERDRLRVMTFNIRYNEPKDGVNAWTNRKQKVADVIRFHKADLVGVQEALIGQLEDLEKLLPAFSWCGVGRTDGKNGGEFSAILYRKDRFKLLECKTFWLSPTPDVAGSKGWDAALPRIVTWARFRDNRTKKVFYHFNTHFDHMGVKARLESAKMIIGRIKTVSAGTRSILTGDLNVKEDTEAYKTLAAADSGLRDARYISRNGHFGGTSTFNGFKELQPANKIDYIFVTPGVDVLEHGVLSDKWDGLWASDHLPVLAEVEL